MKEEKKYHIDDRKYRRKARNIEEEKKVEEYLEKKYGKPKWIKKIASAAIIAGAFFMGYGVGVNQTGEVKKPTPIEVNRTPEPKPSFIPLVTVTPTATPVSTQNPKYTEEIEYMPWYTPEPTPSVNYLRSLSKGQGGNRQIYEALNSTTNYSLHDSAIKGIEEYERLINSDRTEDKQRLIDYGLAFSAQLASNVARGYIAKTEGMPYSNIIATYEKNDAYDFHIRNNNPKETLARTVIEIENGKIKTSYGLIKKYPNEVYELLIYCGTMKTYLDNSGLGVDYAKYAQDHTSGNIEKAKTEILEMQIQSYEKIKTFISEKCIDNQIEEER